MQGRAGWVVPRIYSVLPVIIDNSPTFHYSPPHYGNDDFNNVGLDFVTVTGRPSLDSETCALIKKMARTNPLRGAPRIHEELMKLEIEVHEIKPNWLISRDWAVFTISMNGRMLHDR